MIFGVIIGVWESLLIICCLGDFPLKAATKMNYLKKYNLESLNGMEIRERKYPNQPWILLNNYYQKIQRKGLQLHRL